MSGTILPSLRRFRTVLVGDLAYHARRPLFIVWALSLVLTAWALSSGGLRIQSGDAAVGGTKAHITSEFAVAQQFAIFTILFYGFFIAVSAGMTVIQDGQWRLEELLHATPLRPREYVWGKFAAVLAGCLIVVGIHLAAMVFFNHVVPNAKAQEMRGPLLALNYLKPMLLFSMPAVIFLAGVSFAVGEWTRRPMVVFLLPVAVFLGDAFFLWEWSPGWLDPKINSMLMWVDPSGFRWLNETWLKVDRGVSFYNSAAIPLDPGFLISRLTFVVLGLGAVAWSGRHLGATLRGATSSTRIGWHGSYSPRGEPPRPARHGLGTTRGSPKSGGDRREVGNLPFDSSPAGVIGLAGDDLQAARLVRGRLASRQGGAGRASIQPWSLPVRPDDPAPDPWDVAVGRGFPRYTALDHFRFVRHRLDGNPGDVRLLAAVVLHGRIARAGTINPAVGDRVRHADPHGLAAPGQECRPGDGGPDDRLGRSARRDDRPLDPAKSRRRAPSVPSGLGPVAVAPTILVWIGLVMIAHAITQSRYTTYAIGLAVLWFTGYRLLTDQINWAGNWPLWNALRWSDISIFEMDRKAMTLSRVFATSLAVFLVALTLACFRRRDWDATRVVHLLRPRALFHASWRLIPWAVIPLAAGIWLALEVGWGYEGEAAKKLGKDYWRKNLSTYLDAKVPDLKHVALNLDLFPERSGYHVKGTYDLINRGDQPLNEILLTGGPYWEKLSWTMDGQKCEPKNSAGLFIFTPPSGSLAPGQVVRIGFEHEGTHPRGISKKGGGTMEFILPSSVVLTSFQPTIVPLLGYVEGRASTTTIAMMPRSTATTFTRDKPTRSWVRARLIPPRSRSPARPTSRSTRWGPSSRKRPREGAAPSSGRATTRSAFSMWSRADGRSSVAKARRCIITRAIPTTSLRSSKRSTPLVAIIRSGSMPTPGRS